MKNGKFIKRRLVKNESNYTHLGIQRSTDIIVTRGLLVKKSESVCLLVKQSQLQSQG